LNVSKMLSFQKGGKYVSNLFISTNRTKFDSSFGNVLLNPQKLGLDVFRA